MASIVEQQIVIKMSKLIKSKDDDPGTFISDDIKSSLEQVAEQLVDDDSVIVEVVLNKTETVYAEG